MTTDCDLQTQGSVKMAGLDSDKLMITIQDEIPSTELQHVSVLFVSCVMATKLSNKLSIEQVDFRNKRVLIRVDYNVPLDKNLRVVHPKRVKSTMKTLKYILDQKPKCIVLMSHLGRPKGRRVKKMSLQPVVAVVEFFLKQKVTFLNDCVGAEVEAAVRDPKPGSIFLLENLRFHLAEEGKGLNAKGKKVKATKQEIAQFRASLSKLGDVFVNDAFGTAHRAHSSMVGVDLPVRAAGFLLAKELKAFSSVVEEPVRPYLAILGGAKVKDKIQLIDNMIDKADEIIITGGMAFTFKKTIENVKIGKSLFDEDGAKITQRLVDKAKQKGVKLHFPVDYVTGDKIHANAKVGYATDETGIPDGWFGLDVGPKSREHFRQVILRAKTIVLNGPMGVFEHPPFAAGTRQSLLDMVEATEQGATTIIGGGDSASAAKRFNAKGVTHVSTGGGASLELLEGKTLPGIAYLSDKDNVELKSSL